MSSLIVRRQALQAAAAGVSSGGIGPLVLTAPRIVLGYKASFSVDFYSTLQSAGPFLWIGRGKARPSRLNGRPGVVDYRDYKIPFRVWIGLSRDNDEDFTKAENLMEALALAWQQSRTDLGVDFQDEPLDVDGDPAVQAYSGTVDVIAEV